ncbi:MAG TPA: hypothetical protein VK892_03715 [Pyrinomonadaceae bacterium]|nr:hypothetical protein [Pyrinomonadaceae bacterium]
MSNKTVYSILLVSFFYLIGCTKAQSPISVSQSLPEIKKSEIEKIKNEAKVIHVLVALCDNENQGIVPVPAHLGNGEDAGRNLYWGAAYGVKTFFTKSGNWQKLDEIKNPKENILERLIFKHKAENVYLIADAYRGSKIKETIVDFLSAISGEKLENIEINKLQFQISGSANLIAFIGHNGLMDFNLEISSFQKDEEKRDAVILACASKNYFAKHLKKTSAKPLLWTTNLMAPEAYILHDALEGWVKGESEKEIQVRAASAYAKYQKISQRAAENLLVTGW